jgi:hypothetical protein
MRRIRFTRRVDAARQANSKQWWGWFVAPLDDGQLPVLIDTRGREYQNEFGQRHGRFCLSKNLGCCGNLHFYGVEMDYQRCKGQHVHCVQVGDPDVANTYYAGVYVVSEVKLEKKRSSSALTQQHYIELERDDTLSARSYPLLFSDAPVFDSSVEAHCHAVIEEGIGRRIEKNVMPYYIGYESYTPDIVVFSTDNQRMLVIEVKDEAVTFSGNLDKFRKLALMYAKNSWLHRNCSVQESRFAVVMVPQDLGTIMRVQEYNNNKEEHVAVVELRELLEWIK